MLRLSREEANRLSSVSEYLRGYINFQTLASGQKNKQEDKEDILKVPIVIDQIEPEKIPLLIRCLNGGMSEITSEDIIGFADYLGLSKSNELNNLLSIIGDHTCSREMLYEEPEYIIRRLHYDSKFYSGVHSVIMTLSHLDISKLHLQWTQKETFTYPNVLVLASLEAQWKRLSYNFRIPEEPNFYHLATRYQDPIINTSLNLPLNLDRYIDPVILAFLLQVLKLGHIYLAGDFLTSILEDVLTKETKNDAKEIKREIKSEIKNEIKEIKNEIKEIKNDAKEGIEQITEQETKGETKGETQLPNPQKDENFVNMYPIKLYVCQQSCKLEHDILSILCQIDHDLAYNSNKCSIDVMYENAHIMLIFVDCLHPSDIMRNNFTQKESFYDGKQLYLSPLAILSSITKSCYNFKQKTCLKSPYKYNNAYYVMNYKKPLLSDYDTNNRSKVRNTLRVDRSYEYDNYMTSYRKIDIPGQVRHVKYRRYCSMLEIFTLENNWTPTVKGQYVSRIFILPTGNISLEKYKFGRSVFNYSCNDKEAIIRDFFLNLIDRLARLKHYMSQVRGYFNLGNTSDFEILAGLKYTTAGMPCYYSKHNYKIYNPDSNKTINLLNEAITSRVAFQLYYSSPEDIFQLEIVGFTL